MDEGRSTHLQRALSPSWGEEREAFDHDIQTSGRYTLRSNDGFMFLTAGEAQMCGQTLEGGRRRPAGLWTAEEFCSTRFDTPVLPWERSMVYPTLLHHFADRVVRDITNPNVLDAVLRLIGDTIYAAVLLVALQWLTGNTAFEDSLNPDNPVIVMVSTFLASVLIRAIANSPESREDTCRRMLSDWRDAHDAAEEVRHAYRKAAKVWSGAVAEARRQAEERTGGNHRGTDTAVDEELRILAKGSSPLRHFWPLKVSLAAITNLTSLVHSDIENRCTERAIETHGRHVVEAILQGNDDPLSAFSEALLQYVSIAKAINSELHATATQDTASVAAALYDGGGGGTEFLATPSPLPARPHHMPTLVVETISTQWAVDTYHRQRASDRTLYAWRGVYVEKSTRDNAERFLTIFFYVLIPIPLWYSLRFLMIPIYPIVRYLFDLLLGHMQHKPSLIDLNSGDPTRNVFTLHESDTLNAVGRIGTP